MKKNKIFLLTFGLALFLFSSILLITSDYSFSARQITLLWASNWIGLIFISEYITRLIRSQSLLSLVAKNKKNLIVFFLVCTLSGVIVEGFGQWVGKLWFYPFFTIYQYKLACILGFALYMTTIAEVYMACKSLVDKFVKPPKIKRAYTLFEKALYPKFLFIGCFFVAASLALNYQQYQQIGGYFFNATSPTNFHGNFWLLLAGPFGIWLIAEYIEHKRRRMSFLKDLSREYWNPLIAIFFATVIVGLSMELINLKYGYWVYINWPLQHVSLLGLPIIMLLVAWPLHFIMFLSLFRAVAAESSVNVWSSYIAVRHKQKHIKFKYKPKIQRRLALRSE